MASDQDDFEQNIENLKTTVRQCFARVNASLKARELKTLRHLDALRKQCQGDKDFRRNCVQNIHVRYDNESTLLGHVSNYGVIDFERLNFDNNPFILEDFVNTHDEHIHTYNTFEELTNGDNNKQIETIEETAIKYITKTDNSLSKVNTQTKDIAKKYRDINLNHSSIKTCDSIVNSQENDITSVDNAAEDEKSDSSDPDLKKIDPTDDWLNLIKNQTEIEPSVADVMEHSTITCS